MYINLNLIYQSDLGWMAVVAGLQPDRILAAAHSCGAVV